MTIERYRNMPCPGDATFNGVSVDIRQLQKEFDDGHHRK